MFSRNMERLSAFSLHPSLAIASDYDRTLTDDSLMLFEPALEALRLLKKRYRTRLMVASGRTLDFLLSKLGALQLFDAFVAENGAVLHLPDANVTLTLCGDASQVKAVFRSSLIPYEEGLVIVSTKRTFEAKVRKLVQERGLKVEVQCNRESLMILPPGLNKAVGAKEALSRLGISQGRLICIGDAENDLPLFEIATIRIATGNAIPEVKEKADFVCDEPSSIGIARFLNELLKTLSEIRTPSRLKNDGRPAP